MNHHIFTLTDWFLILFCLVALGPLCYYILFDIVHPRLARKYGWRELEPPDENPVLMWLALCSSMIVGVCFLFIGDALGF